MNVRSEVMAATLMLLDADRRESIERRDMANKALTHVNRAIGAVDSSVFVGTVSDVGSSAGNSVLMMLIEAQRQLTNFLILDRPEMIISVRTWLTEMVGTLDRIDVYDLPRVAS